MDRFLGPQMYKENAEDELELRKMKSKSRKDGGKVFI